MSLPAVAAQPLRARPAPSPAWAVGLGLLTAGWLGLITVLYLRGAIAVLTSSSHVNARPALTTAIAFAVLPFVGIAFGLVRRPWLTRGYLWALGGIVVADVIVLMLVGHGLAFAATGWLTLVAWAGGDRLLKLLVGAEVSPDTASSLGQRSLFAVTIGFGTLSHVALGLGLVGLASTTVYVVLLALLTVLLIPELRALWRAARPALTRLRTATPPADHAWLLLGLATLAAGGLGIVLVEAVAPEIQVDPVYYHLALPRMYLQQGRVEAAHPNFYYGTEMLYLLALGLANQTAAKLINATFFILLLAAVVDAGRRTLTVQAGLYGALLTLFSPLFAWEAGTTKVDLPLAVYCTLAALATYCWWTTARPRWLLVAGALSAFAFSTKLTAVLTIVPIIMLIGLAVAWRERLRIWRGWREIALFTGALVVVGAPWPILQYQRTGNPFYPVLNAIFRSSIGFGTLTDTPPEFLNNPIERAIQNNGLGTGTSLLSLLWLPWRVTFDTSRFAENTPSSAIGLALLCLPLLILLWRAGDWRSRRASFGAVLAFCLLGAVLWAYSGQAIRYGMSQLMPAYLLAGYALAQLPQIWATPRARSWTRGVLGCLLILWSAASVPFSLAIFWNIPDRVPYAVAYRFESPDTYLSRIFPIYDAFQFIAADTDLPPQDLRIVSLVQDGSRFYAPGTMIAVPQLLRRPILAAPDPVSALAELRKLGASYLLIDRNGPKRFMADPVIGQDAFLDAYLDLRYTGRNIEVYRIPPTDTPHPPRVARNLLRDPSFEVEGEQQAGTAPTAAWRQGAAAVVDRSGTASHTGQAAARISPQNHFSQVVPGISPGPIYELRLAARQASTDGRVTMQVIWVDDSAKTVASSFNLFDVTPEWAEYRLLASAPAGATAATILLIDHLGEVWVDDISFGPIE